MADNDQDNTGDDQRSQQGGDDGWGDATAQTAEQQAPAQPEPASVAAPPVLSIADSIRVFDSKHFLKGSGTDRLTALDPFINFDSISQAVPGNQLMGLVMFARPRAGADFDNTTVAVEIISKDIADVTPFYKALVSKSDMSRVFSLVAVVALDGPGALKAAAALLGGNAIYPGVCTNDASPVAMGGHIVSPKTACLGVATDASQAAVCIGLNQDNAPTQQLQMFCKVHKINVTAAGLVAYYDEAMTKIKAADPKLIDPKLIGEPAMARIGQMRADLLAKRNEKRITESAFDAQILTIFQYEAIDEALCSETTPGAIYVIMKTAPTDKAGYERRTTFLNRVARRENKCEVAIHLSLPNGGNKIAPIYVLPALPVMPVFRVGSAKTQFQKIVPEPPVPAFDSFDKFVSAHTKKAEETTKAVQSPFTAPAAAKPKQAPAAAPTTPKAPSAAAIHIEPTVTVDIPAPGKTQIAELSAEKMQSAVAAAELLKNRLETAPTKLAPTDVVPAAAPARKRNSKGAVKQETEQEEDTAGAAANGGEDAAEEPAAKKTKRAPAKAKPAAAAQAASTTTGNAVAALKAMTPKTVAGEIAVKIINGISTRLASKETATPDVSHGALSKYLLGSKPAPDQRAMLIALAQIATLLDAEQDAMEFVARAALKIEAAAAAPPPAVAQDDGDGFD